MKLDRIGWVCSKSPQDMHIVPAVGGDPQDCPQCGQTFNDQLVSFVIHRLSELRDGFIDNTANFYWNRYGGANQDSPAPMEFSTFLRILTSAHGVKGKGISLPEAVSAKRRCLNQCSPPTTDLTDSFPDFAAKDFTEENAFRMLHSVRHLSLPGFTQGVFKREFGLKSLIQYLWCVTSVNVREGHLEWETSYEEVPLKVWNCSPLAIQAKLQKLLTRAQAIKEESKLMSSVFQWLSDDHTNAITPAYGDLTTVIARQLEPSKRRIRTGGNTRDAGLENIVNLDLNGDGSLRTVAGDDLWISYGPQTLGELTQFVEKILKATKGKKSALKGSVLKTLIEVTNPKLQSEGVLEYELTYPPEFECGKVDESSDGGPTFKSIGINTTLSGEVSKGTKRTRTESSRRTEPPSQRSRREEPNNQPGPSNNVPPRPHSHGQQVPDPPARRDSVGSQRSRGSRGWSSHRGSRGSRNSGGQRHEERRRERTPPRERRCRSCNCRASSHARYCYNCARPFDGGRR